VPHVYHKDTQLILALWYSEKMEEITLKKPASVVDISPIIGAHSGVGAAAVALQFE